ncbi:YeiH family protein [Neisseria sp. 83E34]|uniref:YeiH family protein n=1 Tax=Neisseria sp. 83E34 TaxID=1692264 RepID=UPI001E57D956|nr:YeiH family protein [Neisseria sp. 83E34]
MMMFFPCQKASFLQGLLLCAGLAGLSVVSAPMLGKAVSPLLVAIMAGLLLGNSFYPHFEQYFNDGTRFAQKQILRTAIVLYGFKLTIHDLAQVGWSALLIDAIMVVSTFLLAVWLGRRVFGIDRDTSVLIGSGAAICGAAAVLATESVLKAEPYKVAVAVVTVVVFGSLAMIVYPVLYSLHILPFDAAQFGVYTGSTVHEVAQVVAVGGSISPETANTAVITKMVRVMLLAPFLLVLSYVSARRKSQPNHLQNKINIPWFAVGFIAVAGLNSLLPEHFSPWVRRIIHLDDFLLAMAMAALGLTTRASTISKVGILPFKLGLYVFVWLLVGGAAVNWLLV